MPDATAMHTEYNKFLWVEMRWKILQLTVAPINQSQLVGEIIDGVSTKSCVTIYKKFKVFHA